jgi:DNA-directed RNA polymerase subunit RPC12/RpoP
MDALTLILGVLLVGGVLALILYPLWKQTRPESLFQVSRTGQTLEEYQARYQSVLAAIRDLMFDYEMGKVAIEDYELLLTRLKLEAAGYRQQIDRVNRSRSEEIAPALNAEIEAMIDRVRHQGPAGNEALLREVEVEIELLKGVEFEESRAETGVCPRCGKVIQEEDAFCSRCGQPLAQVFDKAEDEEEEEKHTCPHCGYAFVPGDTFCVKCGAVLDEHTASQRYEDARV